jgi:hypothetical protein
MSHGETCGCCIDRAADFEAARYLRDLGMYDRTYESELEARYAPLVAEKGKGHDGEVDG